jgi:hypothetical protein
MASAGIQADTHVFGSTKGYSTVAASKGVRDDERRELESFQLGEASTAARIAQLETRAVMSGRALRSGRFAISRMMPAGVDDAGRPTVEVITLVIEQRDYERCTGALQSLVTDADFWRDARERAASGALIPAMAAEAQPRDPEVLRIFDLWRAASRSGSIGVVSESDSDCLLTMVASLDPADRMRCSWGVGLLSLSTSADICSVASGVSMHGARDVMRLARDGSWHCGSESEYAAFRVSEGLRWLPSIADFERNGRELGVPEWALGSAPSAEPKRAEKRPQSLLPFAIGSAVMSTAVLAVALVMWDRRGGGGLSKVSTTATSDVMHEPMQPIGTPNALDAPLPAAQVSEPALPLAAPLSEEPSESSESPPQPAMPSAPAAEKESRPDATPAVSPAPSLPSTQTEQPPAPLALPPKETKDFGQPVMLKELLARLKETPIPQRGQNESDFAFNQRAFQALDLWIQITYEVNLLDQTCKQLARESEAWKSRDEEHAESDGTASMIAEYSGFIVKWNVYENLPLNQSLRPDWMEFAEELHSRLQCINDKNLILQRMEELKQEVVGPREDPAFADRKNAWEKTLGNLLDAEKLKQEIERLRNLLTPPNDPQNGRNLKSPR